MTRQLILGSAVGLVGGLLSWRGNQTPHLVSTFPDVWTSVVFMVLVTSVVWLELGRQAVPNRSAALRLGAVSDQPPASCLGRSWWSSESFSSRRHWSAC